MRDYPYPNVKKLTVEKRPKTKLVELVEFVELEAQMSTDWKFAKVCCPPRHAGD